MHANEKVPKERRDSSTPSRRSVSAAKNHSPHVKSSYELLDRFDDPTEEILNTFNEEKKFYFDKHKVASEYEKISSRDNSDTLFEQKTKQNIIKTFKFNANSKSHIKNAKFNYSEFACQNNHSLQHAKMAFYDTLLNKGTSICLKLIICLRL